MQTSRKGVFIGRLLQFRSVQIFWTASRSVDWVGFTQRVPGLWGLNLGMQFPTFSAPPSGETIYIRQMSCFRGARMVRTSRLYHKAKFAGAETSRAVGQTKKVVFFMFFVRHAFARQSL